MGYKSHLLDTASGLDSHPVREVSCTEVESSVASAPCFFGSLFPAKNGGRSSRGARRANRNIPSSDRAWLRICTVCVACESVRECHEYSLLAPQGPLSLPLSLPLAIILCNHPHTRHTHTPSHSHTRTHTHTQRPIQPRPQLTHPPRDSPLPNAHTDQLCSRL